MTSALNYDFNATVNLQQQPQPNQIVDPEGALTQAQDGTNVESSSSALPMIGGTIGGLLAPFLVPKPLQPAATAIGRVGQSTWPSVFGTGVGATLGSTLEQSLEGQSLTDPAVLQQIAEDAGEQMAWDAGGNLAFMGGAKMFGLGLQSVNSTLKALGITRENFPNLNPKEALQLAQKFLSQRGATLTAGQYSGGLRETIEGIVKGPFTSRLFSNQQDAVATALMKGVDELKTKIPGTPEYRAQLGLIGDASWASGLSFSEALKQANNAVKNTVKPFYEKLDARGYGIQVDVTKIKEAANKILRPTQGSELPLALKQNQELLALSNLTGKESLASLHAYRSQITADIMKHDNPYEAVKPTVEKAQLIQIKKALDEAIDDAAAKMMGGDAALVAEYRTVTDLVRESSENLFGETLKTALKNDPERVGKAIFADGNVKAILELRKAAKQASIATAEGKALSEGLERGSAEFARRVRVLRADPPAGVLNESQILNNVRQGYIADMMDNPQAILKWANEIESNPNVRRTYKLLFEKDQLKFLDDLANAARKGLAPTDRGVGLTFQTIGQFSGAGTLLFGPGIIAFTLNDENKDDLAKAGLTSLLSGGALVLTQAQIAKAMTDKNAVDALAKLSKYSGRKTLGGAFSKMILQPLYDAGVFDLQSFSETAQQQQPQPNVPFTVSGGSPLNFDFSQ